MRICGWHLTILKLVWKQTSLVSIAYTNMNMNGIGWSKHQLTGLAGLTQIREDDAVFVTW